MNLFDLLRDNAQKVKYWLQNHPDGKQILEALLDAPRVNCIKERIAGEAGGSIERECFERVLATADIGRDGAKLVPMPTQVIIELHADGAVDVYGPRHLRVEIVQRPETHGKPELEILAEQLTEAQLSYNARHHYCPGSLRARAMLERYTIAQMVHRERKRNAEQAIIQGLNGLRERVATEQSV